MRQSLRIKMNKKITAIKTLMLVIKFKKPQKMFRRHLNHKKQTSLNARSKFQFVWIQFLLHKRKIWIQAKTKTNKGPMKQVFQGVLLLISLWLRGRRSFWRSQQILSRVLRLIHRLKRMGKIMMQWWIIMMKCFSVRENLREDRFKLRKWRSWKKRSKVRIMSKTQTTNDWTHRDKMTPIKNTTTTSNPINLRNLKPRSRSNLYNKTSANTPKYPTPQLLDARTSCSVTMRCH